MKFIFRAASDSRTRSRSSPCPHRRAGAGHLYPWLIMELLRAVTWGRKRAKTRCWRSLLAGFVAVLVRVYAGSGEFDGFSRVSGCLGAAGKNSTCSERLNGE